jgi:hypothetical protein
MRPWTIPILGAVALSLAAPSMTNARPRLGPAVVLGVLTAPLGAIFGSSRHSFRHHRQSATRPSDDRRRAEARAERRLVAGALPATAALVFWPDASADLVDYLFFPKGKDDRFWAYGYRTIVQAAFAAPDGDDVRAPRSQSVASKDGHVTAPAKEPDGSAAADLCGIGAAAGDADALIGRIEQAIGPTASQREVLEQLRAALAQAIERIESACPTAMSASLTERLQAIQDRIWAMRDALLMLGLPFEKFYNSLTDEQHWRLRRGESDSRGARAKIADGRALICADPAELGPIHVMERAVRPTEQQRASLETLRANSAGMAQLIVSSCPTYPLLGHMGRFAAAMDCLDVMLFAVMSMSPALQDFYWSLDDKQKTSLNRAIGQIRRSGLGGHGF